jgi:uncharacterized protein YozE (UPF0346 family)
VISETFYVWLTSQRARRDEVGRLGKEAFKDKTFPSTARKLYLFLHYYNSEPENRRAVKLAHAEWRRLRREGIAA